jgi:acyl carrier protein
MKQWINIDKKLPPEDTLVLAKVMSLKIHDKHSPLRIESIKYITGYSTGKQGWFLKRHHYHEGDGDWLGIDRDQIMEWADEIISKEEKPRKNPRINHSIMIHEGEILETIYDAMRVELKLDKKVKIDALSRFSDFEMDNLNSVHVIAEVEKEFDISIPDKKADKMAGVMDLFSYLCKVLDAAEGKGGISNRFDILDL